MLRLFRYSLLAARFAVDRRLDRWISEAALQELESGHKAGSDEGAFASWCHWKHSANACFAVELKASNSGGDVR